MGQYGSGQRWRRAWTAVWACGALIAMAGPLAAQDARQPADEVNPLIGSRHGGNTYPGAVLPFGMLQWSPENTRGKHVRTASPSGYLYDAPRVRGFSLTHLSGAGCAGASGDLPIMPITTAVTTSPSSDLTDAVYASDFSHDDEHARAGSYELRLANGVQVSLAAATRSGIGRFSFPLGQPANLLIRASDSEVGSSAAQLSVDRAARTVSGSVTAGNFCGYLSKAVQRSYYTIYFVAQFDQPITATGAWHDDQVQAGKTTAEGGTGLDDKGFPRPGKGSGLWLAFDPAKGPVQLRVGISYVSLANAKANLAAEIPVQASLAQVQAQAREAWNDALGKIAISGGSADQRTTFYTALYHSLLHPNIFSDVNGEYRGFDQQVHRVQGAQQAQYANFSGWDVYRSQLQLLTWLYPKVGSDIAQSLYNQAEQNGGEWDRWTHNSGGTHVMSGDPAVPALAAIDAFGGHDFDLRGAYASLVKAATVPTAHDLSNEGCNVECVGQRPSLDQWQTLHYIATESNAWGGAAETLEDATADFALAQLAARVGDAAGERQFLTRAGYWRNLYNPKAAPDGGYIQNRNADGSWPAFKPGSDDGFVEGSAAVYLWMVPFDVRGLFEQMGGVAKATARLDRFFHDAQGHWALTESGDLHAELNNEPSVGTPWLYAFVGQPAKTQEAVRIVVNTLWKNTPEGIPGNDDLGEMSSWYVWSALGMYPAIPGRAELILGSPLFTRAVVHRAQGDVVIAAPAAASDTPFVQALTVNGHAHDSPWLPPAFAEHGGTLEFTLGAQPEPRWGSQIAKAPPSFPPPQS